MKFYPLAEFADHHLSNRHHIPVNSIKAIKSGEFREPKKGEFYLSGAIVQAYKAPNDLSSKYHIAKIVQIETVTTYRILKEIK